MDCVLEMKIQALDKMLKMRNQIISMQDNLGVYNSIDNDTSVLIYNTEDFFEIAKEVNASVMSGNITESGRIEILFTYKGVKFNTFILPGEYQLHEHEIDRGSDDD